MCGCRRAAAAALLIQNGTPLQTRTITTYSTQTVEGIGSARRRKGGIKTYTIARTISVPLDVIDTSVWGPIIWRVLHVLSLLAQGAAVWVGVPKALDGALPCPDCRKHYHEWLTTNPLTAYASPAAWVLALHNAVNERLERPVWSMDEVTKYYGSYSRQDVVTALEAVQGMIGSVGADALKGLLAAIP